MSAGLDSNNHCRPGGEAARYWWFPSGCGEMVGLKTHPASATMRRSFSHRNALKWTENAPMDPYIKAKSPLRGSRKPGIRHGPGLPRIERREKEEVASVRRALKKAARREGKKEIAEGM